MGTSVYLRVTTWAFGSNIINIPVYLTSLLYTVYRVLYGDLCIILLTESRQVNAVLCYIMRFAINEFVISQVASTVHFLHFLSH